jgi:hypothetical protein
MDKDVFSDLFDLRECCFTYDCLHSVSKLPDLHSDLDNVCFTLFSDINHLCSYCHLPNRLCLPLVHKFCFDQIQCVETNGAVMLKKICINDGKYIV